MSEVKKFLIVDDERLAREELEDVLRETVPDCDIHACASAKAALAHVQENTVDVAFLDIELGASNGVQLAKRLKDLQPDISIIFVTSYSHYAVDAFAIHATGYLLKPVQPEHIRRELTFLYPEDTPFVSRQVTVRTFGGFEVYVDGQQLTFSRKKAEELLAYLIERNGASVTMRNACAILFEDDSYSRTTTSYYHTILASLRSTLKEAGIEDILIRSYNKLSINTRKIDCDYYRFLAGDVQAVNSYHGEFLPDYSWAEFSTAELSNKQGMNNDDKYQ